MKKIFTILTILTVAFTCKAQHTNLTDTELFDGIKFDNISLGAIMRTQGDLTKIKVLFKEDFEEEEGNNVSIIMDKYISNKNYYFGFEDDTNTGNEYYLMLITVLDPSVVVNVQNLSVSIGDHKRKFGNMLISSNSYSYNFLDADTGSAHLSFKIDRATNKVTAIKFVLY